MQFEKAYSFLIKKLENELPHHFFYHDVEHTKDVLKTAEYLAKSENISHFDLTLIKTAALFHDAGFLESPANHEETSCKIANKILPQFEYSEDEIKKICSLIMATKLPQKPANKLEEILCDADLYYLGTDNFSENAEKLYKEMHKTGTIKNYNDWQNYQIKFLQSHNYFTATANHKLNHIKEQNLKRIQTKFSSPSTKKYIEKFATFGDIILIIIGVITAAFALKGFLVPNNFFDGGISGVSLLIHKIYNFNLAFVVAIANVPFIILGGMIVNFKFALKTAICIMLLSVCIYFIPYPLITSDKVLVSIFGGFFLGIGNGLIMRAGCSLDGIEILALYTRRRTSFTITEIILAINFIIFLIAALKFDIPTSMYSMLTYFTASKTVDYVVEGIEAYTGVTIISSESEIIKDKLVNELNRGITIYKGERGHLPGQFEVYSDCDIIFTVISRLELRKLKNLVYQIDSNAFVFANTVKEATGGVIKRRHAH